MKSNNAETLESQRSSILDIIGQHVTLRQLGREHWGLCPFHAEKTPSFAVNPEKGLFYCHGCHVGGDAITFIERIQGVDFKTAAKQVGRDTFRPSPDQLRIRREAKCITEWAHVTSTKICDELREISGELHMCKAARQLGHGIDRAEVNRHEAGLIRRWAILEDLDDDLNNPKLAVELWAQRAEIDAFVESLA